MGKRRGTQASARHLLRGAVVLAGVGLAFAACVRVSPPDSALLPLAAPGDAGVALELRVPPPRAPDALPAPDPLRALRPSPAVDRFTPRRGLPVRLAVYGRKLVIPADRNGHFYVTARVKRQPPSYSFADVRFMVDTGATLVSLRWEDAERAGFEEREVEFTGMAATANGLTRVAPASLPELRVDRIKIKDVVASLHHPKTRIDISLLGNTFLGRLERYTVSDGELVLEW